MTHTDTATVTISLYKTDQTRCAAQFTCLKKVHNCFKNNNNNKRKMSRECGSNANDYMRIWFKKKRENKKKLEVVAFFHTLNNKIIIMFPKAQNRKGNRSFFGGIYLYAGDFDRTVSNYGWDWFVRCSRCSYRSLSLSHSFSLLDFLSSTLLIEKWVNLVWYVERNARFIELTLIIINAVERDSGRSLIFHLYNNFIGEQIIFVRNGFSQYE